MSKHSKDSSLLELPLINFAQLHHEIQKLGIRFLLISVDGIPGSGKTKRLDVIQRVVSQNAACHVVVIPEPVDKWIENGSLSAYYSDPSRYGYTFQTLTFSSRVQYTIKTIYDVVQEYKSRIAKDQDYEIPEVTVLLSERTVESDGIFFEALFQDKRVTASEHKWYFEWCAIWKQMIPKTEVVYIFIDSSVQTAMERVNRRDRKGEESIDHSYQRLIHKHHQEFIRNKDKAHVLFLDGNVDVDTDEKGLKNQCNQISEFISSQLVLYDLKHRDDNDVRTTASANATSELQLNDNQRKEKGCGTTMLTMLWFFFFVTGVYIILWPDVKKIL